MKKKNNSEDKEYYLSTKDREGEFLIYESKTFKLSEIDLLNLIKICLVESRSKAIGKKILEVYRDSTYLRKELSKKRLNLMGLDYDDRKPTKTKIPKTN